MIINAKALSELVKIEEKIYEFFNSLDFYLDDNVSNKFISYIKMFLSKEKRIISEIPIDDKEFNDSILERIDDVIMESIEDTDNYNYIVSRLGNFFHDCNLGIKPNSHYVHVFDGESLYVEDNYKKSIYDYNLRNYYKNLIIRYIKYIDGLKSLGIYDDEEIIKIQKYNLYIEKDIFDEYVRCDFDINNINDVSDDQLCSEFGYNDEEFINLKVDVICCKLYELIILMFNCSNDSMNYLDYELNFKYFIYELSYDTLVSFVSLLNDFLKTYFEGSGKNIFDYKDTIDLINRYLHEEISRKSVNNGGFFEISQEDYDKLSNFVSLEKKIVYSIDNLDFQKDDLDNVKKIDLLLDIEEDFVSHFKNISIMDLSYFFTVELAKVLDDSRLFDVINYRVFHLIPVFNILYKMPGQSIESFEIINRNYFVSSIKQFYKLMNTIDDTETRKVFLDVYKRQFYMNPFLTRLLTQLNGNHLMIEPFDLDFSSEFSGVDGLEYRYDLDNQLFLEAVNIIQKLAFSYDNIQDVDKAYFHLWLIQFNYICGYLGYENLDNLFDLLLRDFQDSHIFDVLINIVRFNLNGIDYNLDVSISSSNTKINVLTFGGD